MSSTPKWYCRKKSQPMHTFADLTKLGNELRRITKRIVIDVKVDIYSEHGTILEECEKVIELYWSLKDESKNEDFMALSKKIKRSPYNALLVRKFHIIMAVNERRFCQLTFVLKKTLSYLLRKSMQSEVWLNWALQITHLYNKCRSTIAPRGPEVGDTDDSDLNANICSNMYPTLLLPFRSIDFAYVLQHVSQVRVEQNALDLLFGLFNMVDSNVAVEGAAWTESGGSNCSSLEILRILTLNLTGEGDFQQFYDPQRDYGNGGVLQLVEGETLNMVKYTDGGQAQSADLDGKRQRRQHTEQFLQKERAFIAQLIERTNEICPTVFDPLNVSGGSSNLDLRSFIARGIRLMWAYVGLILDHIILWWIDTPISCYSLAHVDTIRSWLFAQSPADIPEPVFSTLRGIGEILTNFVCNNIWDELFRLTLISLADSQKALDTSVAQYSGSPTNHLGTGTGKVWITLLSNMINLSNNYFPRGELERSNAHPVAEQIPILHRIDHTVHSMRLWAKEQCKQQCCLWQMKRFFQILEHDVKICMELFINLQLPKLSADLSDILMLVCVALRTKLVTEVHANIDKLKKTTDECVQILSAVCRVLSLANLSLCFPPASHWHRNVIGQEERSNYVSYLLDNTLLPVIKSTKDIQILKLVLKIICESWLDYIYKRRIKFSVNGAIRLLNDFDDVREWLLNCSLLSEEHADMLSNHEVLRMCNGVGKILLRKPEDIISIAQAPKYEKRSSDAPAEETQLPSEMFVSNQKHWLELRAQKSNFPFWSLCCSDM